jgi:uncharacterized protein
MMSRFIYSIQQAFKYRQALINIKDRGMAIKKLIDINQAWLDEQNVQTLVLDFDGVMATHGEELPCEEVVQWLNALSNTMPQKNIYILSNKPTLLRKQYFQEHYPEITFVAGVRKKPYPDGMNAVAELSKVSPEYIALVDDRLLTGCLACVIAGAKPIWVTEPYTNVKKHPVPETFFKVLRWMDRKFVGA